MNNPNCKKYQRGDQYYCDRCILVWDINDDDPPDCGAEDDTVEISNPEEAFKQIHDIIDPGEDK